jgi:hypothetical protein
MLAECWRAFKLAVGDLVIDAIGAPVFSQTGSPATRFGEITHEALKRGEAMPVSAHSPPIDFAFAAARVDHLSLRLAGWASHRIDAPNNSAPVKKRTRKNFPRKIKIIPPFRGVFFGEFFGLFFGLLKIEFFGIFSELLGGFIFRFLQGSF